MLEITGTEINALNDSDLRSLVGLLCEAELRNYSIPTAGVTFGGHQDAQDGGLDVRVQISDALPANGFIPKPNTGFQVKKPDMPRSDILQEMKPKPKGELREVICELASMSGAYIIVSNSASTTDKTLRNRREAMREALAGNDNAHQLTTDFYDRERIAGWVRSHPSLILWVRDKIGMPIFGWRPFENWANPSVEITEEYLLDEKLRLYSTESQSENAMAPLEGINCLRKALHQPRSSIRLIGLSGVGKTRLLQALFDNRIGESPLNPSQVLYTDMGFSPNPAPGHFAEYLIALKRPAILAIDNCPADLHRHLTSLCKASGSLVSLITVEYDIREDEPEETDVFRLEPASTTLMEELVLHRFPDVSQINARTIANFSGGNSRIAIALAATVSKDESLVHLRDEDLVKRLFEQRNTPNPSLLKSAEVCSLVYSFEGEKTDDASELSLLGSLANIEGKVLFSDVSELKRRGLVQQRNIWRAVLPHAIANRLAQTALEDFPLTDILKVFEGGPERLLQSFSRRLSYLHENQTAQTIAKEWLSRDGLLEELRVVSEFKVKLLTNIAPIVPDLVVKAIEDAVAKRGSSLFCRSNPHIDKLSQILRSTAYAPELFERNAFLLSQFALAKHPEGKHFISRALLESLFFMKLSGTYASANQRLKFIESLVNSQNEEVQDLGLHLLKAALQAGNFSTDYNFDFGGHSRDYGYWPKNLQESQQWYTLFINFAMTLALSEKPIAMKAKKLLAKKFRELWVRAGMFDLLEEVAKTLGEKGGWNEGWKEIADTIKFNTPNMKPQTVVRLKTLQNVLTPSTLIERSRAVLGLSAAPIPDFHVSDQASKKRSSDQLEQNEIVAEQIGKEVAETPEEFNQLLPEMFEGKGTRPFYFGRGLAAGCNNHQEMWKVLCKQYSLISSEEKDCNILGGFISGTFTKNPDIGEIILDKAVSDDIVGPIYPWLQTRVDITPRAVQRLKQSLMNGIASISLYGCLGFGRVHESIDNENFCDLLKIIKTKPDGLPVAINIFDMRISGESGKNFNDDLHIISLGQELLNQLEFSRSPSNLHSPDLTLSLIVDTCLEGPTASATGATFCKKMAKAMAVSNLYPPDYVELLGSLAKKQPIIFLDCFLIGDSTDGRQAGGGFSFDLDVERNPLSKMEDSIILKWCRVNPGSRYGLLASVLPSFRKNGGQGQLEWTPLAQALIEEAPDPIPVLDGLKISLRPMSDHSGSRIKTMEERLSLISNLKSHQNPLVSEWAEMEEKNFQNEINFERQWREKHSRIAYESFE